MHYCKIKTDDIANGPGVRVSLYVSGCPHRCKGCFNPETWDYNAGKPFTEKEVQKIIDSLKPEYISGLSLLGGEPLDTYDKRDFIRLLIKVVKSRFPDIKICIWTGYTYEQIRKFEDQTTVCHLLECVDKLIEGPFLIQERDITLNLRGSRNQRIFVHPHNCYPTGYMVESIDSK